MSETNGALITCSRVNDGATPRQSEMHAVGRSEQGGGQQQSQTDRMGEPRHRRKSHPAIMPEAKRPPGQRISHNVLTNQRGERGFSFIRKAIRSVVEHSM